MFLPSRLPNSLGSPMYLHNLQGPPMNDPVVLGLYRWGIRHVDSLLALMDIPIPWLHHDLDFKEFRLLVRCYSSHVFARHPKRVCF